MSVEHEIPDPDDPPAAQTPDVLIEGLRRRVVTDEWLCARAPVPVIERALEGAVRSMWDASRVKSFVPVLALRQVREEIGAAALLGEAPVPPGRG